MCEAPKPEAPPPVQSARVPLGWIENPKGFKEPEDESEERSTEVLQPPFTQQEQVQPPSANAFIGQFDTKKFMEESDEEESSSDINFHSPNVSKPAQNQRDEEDEEVQSKQDSTPAA